MLREVSLVLLTILGRHKPIILLQFQILLVFLKVVIIVYLRAVPHQLELLTVMVFIGQHQPIGSIPPLTIQTGLRQLLFQTALLESITNLLIPTLLMFLITPQKTLFLFGRQILNSTIWFY